MWWESKLCNNAGKKTSKQVGWGCDVLDTCSGCVKQVVGGIGVVWRVMGGGNRLCGCVRG